MQNFFSHSYSSKFSFFSPDHNILPQSHSTSICFLEENSLQDPKPKAFRTIKAFTVNIIQTFQKCNNKFYYDPKNNLKRCLTHPEIGIYNEGYDNIHNEYILYLNDVIKSPENHEYQIKELLGKGTFGQVIRCVRAGTNEEYAMKIIKNKPAYTNQSLTEIKIYRKLKEESARNENYVVRLHDYFAFRNHICLLFEILNISLFDLLKLNKFSGFSFRFIARLTQQVLEGMVCLEKNKIIHCDLKPENILLQDDQSDILKIIDLGSACFLHNTVYTYIQSRFYRAPEVILGLKYTNKIDSWSLGCIVGEFYLGHPIFPGNSEYDQLKRIVDVMGMPENEVLESGRFKNKFFNKQENGTYVFKTVEEYEKEQDVELPPRREYLVFNKLADLELHYNRSKLREKQPQEFSRLECFIHFLNGLLHLNPMKRWTSSQALYHPFLTNEEFVPTWEPPTPEQAIEKFDLKTANLNVAPKTQSTFSGFTSTVPTPSLNAESYRPFIPPAQPVKKEEVISQSQNVYLLNNQANSTKPKRKLNLNAASFNTSSFYDPNQNREANSKNISEKSEQFGSYSEPNSARSLDYKPNRNKNHEKKNKNEYQSYVAEGYSSDMGESKEDPNLFGNNKANNNQFYMNPPIGYKKNNNTANANFAQPYYHPPSQFSDQYNNQYNNNNNKSNLSYRQRSNSDQGTDDNLSFKNKNYKNKKYGNNYSKKKYYNTGNNGSNNYINPQEIRDQPTPDTAETSYSSNDFEFKNKIGSI